MAGARNTDRKIESARPLHKRAPTTQKAEEGLFCQAYSASYRQSFVGKIDGFISTSQNKPALDLPYELFYRSQGSRKRAHGSRWRFRNVLIKDDRQRQAGGDDQLAQMVAAKSSALS